MATHVNLITYIFVAVALGCEIAVVQGESNETSPSNLDMEHSRPDYRSILDSAVMPYYVMAEWFLEDLVQLSYLYDLEDSLGRNFTQAEDLWKTWEDDWDEWMVYLIGFVLCAVVGVVLIIGMPIAGSVTACCRCCGNCGGHAHPQGAKNDTCCRWGCGIALLVVTAAIMFGIVGMFMANEQIKARLKDDDGNMFSELSMSVEAMEKYTENTVEDLNRTVLGQYIQGKQNLYDELDDIPENALIALDEETGVVGNLTVLTDFVYTLPVLEEALQGAQNMTDELKNITTELDAELTILTADIINIISECNTSTCNDTKEMVNNLGIGNNASEFDFTIVLNALDTVLMNGTIINITNASIAELEVIKNEVATVLETPINDTKKVAEDIQEYITSFIVEVDDEIGNIPFKNATDALDSASDEVQQPADYVYWSLFSLGIILCITVLCNIVGVAVGMFCPPPKPGDGICATNQAVGADWLLAGIVFTFAFYWIYATVVLAAFLGGGVAHTEFCQHAINYDTKESARVLDIYDRIINDTLYDSLSFELEVFALYKDCKDNASFYQAGKLESRGYNITEIIDLTEVENMVNKIKNIDVNLPPVNIMSTEFLLLLNTLDKGLQLLDFEYYNQELQKSVVTENLTAIALMLDEIYQNDPISYPGLNISSAALISLTITHVDPAEDIQYDLIGQLNGIENLLTINVSETAVHLANANSTINNEGEDIIGGFVNDTVDDIYEDIVTFSSNIERSVINDVGSCYDMYQAITDAVDATCVLSLYQLHALWYSLGWIMFFLFPSIILSFKLVGFYRKNVYDGYDEDRGYDAFEDPGAEQFSISGQHHDVLLEKMERPEKDYAMDADVGAGEFENPVYMTADETEFKIPRPSLKSTPSDASSTDFKIPRPQLYPSTNPYDADSGPPSYIEIGAVNPAAEDTQL